MRLPPATSSRRWSRRRSGPAAPASPRPSRPWAWSRRSRRRRTRAPARPVGWLDQPDGAVTLGGGLPGAVLPARMAEFLAAVDRPWW
ncbi:hypothetical protein ACYAFX_14205 [Rhodococcus aetherivorans]